MGKINMINMQPILLQEKFGKRQEKKNKYFAFVMVCLVLVIFFSLLFLNTESQELISSSKISPGFLKIGDLSHG
jgi:uncharacterized membrane protein (DUF485 family)|tara:strand:- start:113 stop:334 length:222 start_codon:yes stop_codon:yes gene_type:complete